MRREDTWHFIVPRTAAAGCQAPTWLADSQEFPFQDDGYGSGNSEDEQENRQLFAEGVTSFRNADPHIKAGDE